MFHAPARGLGFALLFTPLGGGLWNGLGFDAPFSCAVGFIETSKIRKDEDEMSTESKPAESQSVSLKPVLIAMIVAAALPLLICSGGFLEVLSAPLTGGAMITIALGLTAFQNAWVLFACIATLRGRRTYLLPLTASVAVFLAWFWTAFTPLSVGFQILGTLISIPIARMVVHRTSYPRGTITI